MSDEKAPAANAKLPNAVEAKTPEPKVVEKKQKVVKTVEPKVEEPVAADEP